jgi:hypothetical protein
MMNIAVETLYNFRNIYVIEYIYICICMYMYVHVCITYEKILYNIFELTRVQIKLNKWVS